MQNKLSNPQNALILFTDIIDSSQYSAILDANEYANKVNDFREVFEKLGEIYFPNFSDDEKITKYCKINTIGDEGSIFYVNSGEKPPEIVFKSVQFAFELKARWELKTSSDTISKKIKLGIGIHFGKVVPTIKIEENHSTIINDIIGYPINYAKRIESCSRDGKYSRVFVSKEAASLIEGVKPIVLAKISLPMKGIANSEEMFEIRSVFFEEMPLNPNKFNHENFLDFYSEENLELLREPWLKGLVASVIDSQCRRTSGEPIKINYMKKLSEFAWRNITEDDPILLFRRACECEQREEYTMMLTILKEIVKNYPTFIYARKKLVRAFTEVAKKSNIQSERIFARDIAQEFIEHFPKYIQGDEELKYFKEIIDEYKKAGGI